MGNNGKIGIFDSGIGGVTVLKEIIKILPNEEYIYYSDSIHNPYGDKSDDEIIKICENIVIQLLEHNCKVIVIACNTASAKAAEYLRRKYIDKIFVAIEPAYKMVHDFAYAEPTLVMATKATIESEKFNCLLKKYDNHKTFLLPCIGLADMIESQKEEEIEKYLKEHLQVYSNKVKNVVLGCTHYPLIKKQIKKILGDVTFFDGSARLAVHLKEILINNNLINTSTNKGNIQFVDSSKSMDKELRFYNILNGQVN